MLIVALGVLTLLSLLAVTFVTLMRLEKNAATNYVDGVKAKLVAEAGLQRIVADMKKIAKESPFDTNGQLRPFIYGATPTKEVNVALKVEELSQTLPRHKFFVGRTGASYKGEGAGDEYRLKVVDTSSLLDLNFPMDRQTAGAGSTGQPIPGQVLQRMLEALGDEIRRTRLASGLEAWDPVGGAQDPKSRRKPITFAGNNGAYAILAYRATLDGQRFSSKTQLQEIMEEASYQLLSDFVTAHGAVDDLSVVPATSPGTGGHSKVKLLLEPRSMVNVNLAPREVLVAAIAPLAGRRHVYHVLPMAKDQRSQEMEKASDQIVKDNYNVGPSTLGTGDEYRVAQKEDIAYDVREGWIYVGPFGHDYAENIVTWIIANRPFNGYSDFHERLSTEMLKPLGRAGATAGAGALDDYMPKQVLGSSTPITTPGVRIFPPRTPNQDRYNIAGIEGQPYFGSLVREAGYSILLANFSPAFVANSAVPNTASYLPVDKGNLLYPDEQGIQNNNDGVLYSRQTLDFCYDTKGVFEVTSLGQIKKAFGEIVAQEKILTVVKLLGQVTHRTQYDFEKNDALYTSGAGNPRTTFTTFPNPRRIFTTLTAPTDFPDTNLASSDWGHVEVDIRSLYENDPSAAPARFRALATAPFGTPLFGTVFEWYQKDLGLNQEMAIHAFMGNRQPIGSPTDVSIKGQAANLPFNRARGTLQLLPRSRSSWYVSAGSGTLYNDGVHMGYRTDRDETLWYRAGATAEDPQWVAGTNAELDQGALPLAGSPEAAGFTGAPPEIAPTGGGGTGTSHQQGNVWYRKGGIEFWYKPDFDWAYPDGSGNLAPFPLFCGYVFASRVYYNPGVPNIQYGDVPQDASIKGRGGDARGWPTDGTQLYVFRNTEGQIRATRLFFRVVGKPDPTNNMAELPRRFLDPDQTDVYGGQVDPEYPGQMSFLAGPLEPNDPASGGAIEVFRRGSERNKFALDAQGKATGYPWPPLEFADFTGGAIEPYVMNEKYIKHARVDAYVPSQRFEKWRAGEWHHIAVYWDDGKLAPHDLLRIYVDGVRQSEAKPIGDPAKAQFCRLNEPPEVVNEGRYPRDQLQVGYIQRRIAKTDEGVFKHKNVINPGGSTLSQDSSKITLFACGVIDDFITYDGNTNAGATPPDIIQVPDRFEPDATYVQHFDLASRMPGGGKSLELAKISWNVLFPGTAHGPNAGRQTFARIEVTEPGDVVIRKAIPASAPPGPIQFDNMRDASFAKLEIRNQDLPALIHPANTKLRYEITLKSASYGATAGIPALSNIDTPALHEVSVSYFLPTEETLLKERIVN